MYWVVGLPGRTLGACAQRSSCPQIPSCLPAGDRAGTAAEAFLPCRCPWCGMAHPTALRGRPRLCRAGREECLPWCSMLGHGPCTSVALPASEFCSAHPFSFFFFAVFVGGSFPSSTPLHLWEFCYLSTSWALGTKLVLTLFEVDSVPGSRAIGG